MQSHNDNNFFSKARLAIFPIALGILSVHCGLFHKGVPNAGDFCDVMVKPPVCIHVDFANQSLEIQAVTVALDPVNRLNYNFLFPETLQKGFLSVNSEHRVDLTNQDTGEKRFYLRKKQPRF